MRSKALFSAVLIGFLTVQVAPAAEPSHLVERGDTLWDLSGRFWNDEQAWPELWALNPHFRNPHWILPGDPIYLGRARAETTEVRLPIERLAPTGGERDRMDAARGSGTGAGPGTVAEGAEGSTYRLTRNQAHDFIAPERLPRWGTVHMRHQIKVAYAEGEDVEFSLNPDVGLQPGDLVTVVDDRQPVNHPLNGTRQGYYVEVLGHMEVLVVAGDRGVGRLVESFDAVEEGAGIIPYREPLLEVALRYGPADLEGVILRGQPGVTLFSTDDLVFLDRGSQNGLEVGMLLEIDVREGKRAAQGMVDLRAPLATLLVTSVEENTATCVIVSSRAAVEAGDRFVAGFSP